MDYFGEIPQGKHYIIPQDISALVFDFDGTTSPIGLTEGWRQEAFKQVIRDLLNERTAGPPTGDGYDQEAVRDIHSPSVGKPEWEMSRIEACKQVIRDLLNERTAGPPTGDGYDQKAVRNIHSPSVGKPEWEMSRIIAERLNSVHDIACSQDEIFSRWLSNIEALLAKKGGSLNDRIHFVPGIRALLEGAKQQGLKTAICTAGHNQYVGRALETFGTVEFYDELVYTNMHLGVRHKPEPDPYLKAFELLGIDSPRALVFEDSVSGALSGIRAGATVLFQPSGDRKPRRKAILKLQEKVLEEDQGLERYKGKVVLLAPGEGWRQVRFNEGRGERVLSRAG